MDGFYTENAYEGVYRRSIDGLETEQNIIHCSPGDWPAIKSKLVDGTLWGTLRLGPHLVAIGPPRGTMVDAIRNLLGCTHPADRVMADDGADAV